MLDLSIKVLGDLTLIGSLAYLVTFFSIDKEVEIKPQLCLVSFLVEVHCPEARHPYLHWYN